MPNRNDEFKNQGPLGNFRAGGVEMNKSQARISVPKVINESNKLKPSSLVQLF